jgi:Lon protease-like protein
VLHDLPLFPLGLVLLPHELQPLHVFEPRYRELVARCEASDEPFAIVLADDEGMRQTGCTCRIAEVLERYPDGRSNIVVRGADPVLLVEVSDVLSYRTAIAEELADDATEAPSLLQERALASFAGLVEESGAGGAASVPEAGPQLSYELAGRIEFGTEVKQRLLEDRDEARRLARVVELIAGVRRGLRLTAEVQRRAARNGRVRTPDEIAGDLGL